MQKAKQPKSFGVIGYPIDHSLSPKIHGVFADLCDINIDYRAYAVQPEDLESFIHDFFAGGGCGLNVTAPHKQAVFELCDQLTERARLAGAVNTLYQQDDQLWGDNTDGVGLIHDLKLKQFSVVGRRILLVGAGGAVRGILAPLLAEAPSSVCIVNRNVEKAEALARMFQNQVSIEATSFSALEGCYDALINSLSLPLGDAYPNLNCNLETGAWSYDLNYGARSKVFEDAAKTLGCSDFADGFGMLLAQAAESFALWLGKRPPLTHPRLLKILDDGF